MAHQHMAHLPFLHFMIFTNTNETHTHLTQKLNKKIADAHGNIIVGGWCAGVGGPHFWAARVCIECARMHVLCSIEN